MTRKRPSLTVLAVVAAITMSLALGLPVAANIYLSSGDSAQVSYTNGDGVNVRSGPGYTAGILTTLNEGAQYVIHGGPVTLDDGSTWFDGSAATSDGYVDGWIVADYLSEGGSGGAATSTSDSGSSGGSVALANAAATAVVSGTEGNGLRLRDGGSTDAAVLLVMPEGASVTILASGFSDSEGRLWSQVDYDGSRGYAASAYLAAGDASQGTSSDSTSVQPVANEPASGLAVGQRAAVSGTDGYGLNLRYEGRFSAGVMTVIAEGQVVTVLDGPVTDDSGSTWYQVDYSSSVGWANGGYLVATDAAPSTTPTTAGSEQPPAAQPPADPAPAAQPPADPTPAVEPTPADHPATAEPTPPAEQPVAPASGVGAAIVAEALNYVGYPYVWGGTTPSGFDSSGFVYYVMNKVVGNNFPRLYEGQTTQGIYVSPDQLQPGDLVYFQNTYKWGLSHGGIYIGGGQFVHASNETTGVIISNVWDSYWGPRYYTARRVN